MSGLKPGKRACVLLALVGQVGFACASSLRAMEGVDYGFEGESDLVWVKGPWEELAPS